MNIRFLPDDAMLWTRVADLLRQFPKAQVGVGLKPITADDVVCRAKELVAK